MRRGLGLVRVSKIGNRGDLISPDLQRTAINIYAPRAGIRIVEWREALDESGSQTRSAWWRTLDGIITEVETGAFDTIVVWKFNRAARHRARWAVALDRIEKANATLESATEGVDTTTSTGRFTRGMLAELAAFEAERIGEVWKEVKTHRTSQGLTGDGQFRFGYDLEAGHYIPGEHAPLLRIAYEQAAQGVSLRVVTDEVTGLGGVTKYGNPYTPWHFGKMLRAGFGAGLIHTKTGWVQGAHQPVINQGLWEQFQQRPPTAAGVRHGKHPLSGLLRCAYCLKPLHAAYRKGAEAGMYWRCPRALPECPGTYGWAPKIDRLLNEWLTGLLDGQDPLFQQLLKQPAAPDLRARRKLVKVEKDLLLIAEKNLSGFYDDPTYHRLRAGLLDEQRLLRKTLAVEAAPLRREVVAQALAGEERGVMLRLVLAHVLVLNGERPKYRIVEAWRV